MRDELRKAIAATRGLTTDELTQLRNHATALLALGPSSADRIETSVSHNDWVLMGLVDYCRAIGMENAFVVQLTSGKDYDTFKQKLPSLHSYLKKVGDRNAQRALLRVGFELLREDLSNMRLAVSARLMMSHIHRLPGVINRQFPDYFRSGIMHMIIRGVGQDVRSERGQRSVQRGRKRPPSE